jgi:hypothetical protein
MLADRFLSGLKRVGTRAAKGLSGQRPWVVWALPIILVFLVFREFMSGPLHLQVDSAVCFVSNHYYLKNIARGVLPFWNPFNAWGRPEDFTWQMNGIFNPFLYLTLLLHGLGLSFILAYKFYLAGYFAFGLWGFYLLARRLFEEWWQAYFALLLLLFSNLWINLFNDALTILIFIPAVWCFYFAVAFFKDFQLRDYLGLVLALMMVLTTYLPFYFVLTAFFVLAFFLLFYAGSLSRLGRGVKIFVKSHPVWFWLGLGLLGLYTLPGLLWMLNSPDYAVSWRGSPDGDPLKLSLVAIDNNPGVGQNAWEDCFTGQNICIVNFYVSIFAFLVAWLAVFVSVGRRTLLFAAVAVCLVLVFLGSATPLYGLLTKMFFFMKYFRNIHFLIWFAVPFGILAVCDLAGRFVKALPTWPRLWAVGFLVVWHALAAVFLAVHGDVPLTSWITIVLSLFFCLVLLWTGYRPMSVFFSLALFILVALQPIGVMGMTTKDWGKSNMALDQQHYQKPISPMFSYVRPYRGSEEEKWSEAPGFGEMTDTSGYPATDFNGMRWTYFFQDQIAYDDVKDYVRHKFIIYDRATALPDTESSFTPVREAIRSRGNIAYVLGTGAGLPHEWDVSRNAGFQMIDKDSPEFKVVSFDLDRLRLKTHFDRSRFLVYNDSYHPGWRASLNGRKVPLYRANIAFKGLYLPAGENDVVLEFPDPWLGWLYPAMIAMACGLFAFIVILSVRPSLATYRWGKS